MAKIILVSGLVPYDSGKTWFTVAVARAIRERGLRVGVFKPVAGHNLWYSPRTYRETIKLRMLVGNDILMYHKNGLSTDLATSNPIAIATLPPDPTRYDRLSKYFEEFEDIGKVAVLTRIYNCKTGALDHYLHSENLYKMSTKCRVLAFRLQTVLNAKTKPFTEIAKYFMSPSVEKDLDYCLERISRSSDLVFVEGFNDALIAYTSLIEKANLLVVVAPGKVLVYNNISAVEDSVKKSTSKYGYEGLRTRYIIESLSPNYTFETGLALKPDPRKVHRDFIEKVIVSLLSN